MDEPSDPQYAAAAAAAPTFARPPPPRDYYLPIMFFGLHPLFWADVRVFAVHIDSLHSSPEARDTHFLLGVHPIQKCAARAAAARSSVACARWRLTATQAPASLFARSPRTSPSPPAAGSRSRESSSTPS